LALLQRAMDYKRLSVSEAVAALTQAVATVVAALAGLKYWSLVIGAILGKTTGAALNYYWQPVAFRAPRWDQIRSAIRMGGQIATSRLAWSAYTQSDGIVVGRILGESALGTYQMALTLASAPAEKISTLIMRAGGPLFARIQNDAVLVRRYFGIILEGLAFAVFPLMLGLAMVAPDAVNTILGPKWVAVAAPLTWLAIFVTLRTVSALCDQVLVSLRRTGFTMGMSLMNLALMPAAFLIASRWGINAVAASWLALSPVTVFPLILKVGRAADISIRNMITAVMPAVIASAAMLSTVALVRRWPTGGLSRSVVEICARGAIYALVLSVFFRERVRRYIRFLRSLRGPDDVNQHDAL
jgi:teichuronic acid exporter